MRDTEIDTCHGITFSAVGVVKPAHLAVRAVYIGNDCIKGCPFGQRIVITETIFIGMTIIGTITVNLCPVVRELEDMGTGLVFRRRGDTVLFHPMVIFKQLIHNRMADFMGMVTQCQCQVIDSIACPDIPASGIIRILDTLKVSQQEKTVILIDRTQHKTIIAISMVINRIFIRITLMAFPAY